MSRTELLAAGSFRRLAAAGEIGSLLAAVSIAGTLAAVSGASHTAGGNAAGLGGGGQGRVPGGQGIAAVGGQLRGGEEHKVGIAQGSAAVNGAAVAAGDGHSGVLGDAGAAAVHVTGASAAHTAGGAEGDAGLLRRQVHPHTGAAACRQHRAAGDGDGAVGVQRLVVRRVGCPHGDGAAGDGQVTVGIEAVSTGGAGGDDAAGDIHAEGIAAQIGVGSVETVAGGENVNVSGEDVQLRRLNTLVALRDGDGGAVGAVSADVQHQIAVNGVVSGENGQGAALHIQQLLGVDGVVDRRIDGQRQLPDGQGGLALLGGGRAGLDAVLAVGVDGQRAAAAQRHLRAVLALDDGVFRLGVVGIAVVIVFRRVGQAVGGAVRHHDDHLCGLAAEDGRGVGAGQRQSVQRQRHAGGALFDLNGAVGAGSRHHISACPVDGQGSAVDLIAGVAAVLGGDAAVGKGKGRGAFQRVDGGLGFVAARLTLRAAGRQRKHQRRRAEDGYELFHKMTSFVILLRFMEKGSGGPLPLLCRYHIPPT